MEILGGLGKGMNLKVPDGMEVRPTAVRSRRALFDILGDLAGKTVYDLCAGSGAIGLEAASRGAEKVVFVERSPRVLSILRSNVMNAAHTWSPETRYTIIPGSIPECFRKITVGACPPDLIFADPPYAESANLLDALLNQSDFTVWVGSALLIWELPDRLTPLKVFPADWKLESIRELGAARFLMIRKKE